jgi:hypothetical protein
MMITKYLRQQGQSTTEFIVVSLVLVPIMIIVPLLGKYMDIAQTATVAGRYVAFEGAVHNTSNGWKTDATLADEVRRRFFSNTDAPIKTSDTAGNFTANRNMLWADSRGGYLLPNLNNNIGVITIKESLQRPYLTPYAGSFNLSRDNLYTGTVNVSVANVASSGSPYGIAPFDHINLAISRHTVVLVDGWAAKSVGDVQSKVQDATLAFPYDVPLKPTASLLNLALSVFEPSTKSPDIGRVDPNVVPANRVLQAYK